MEIRSRPGTPCGAECGLYACGDDPGTVQCVEWSRNSCGGCGLAGFDAGDPCEVCGVSAVAECRGTDVICPVDVTRNDCGGCADLEALPGTECGACGIWACADSERVFCDDPCGE